MRIIPKIAEFNQSDWNSIASIYQEGIDTSMATFETIIPSWNQWDNTHIKSCRLKATISNNIVGWAALSPISHRTVYKGVAEVSIYVSNQYKKTGIGKLLLSQLITKSEKEGFWTLQAGIFSANVASIQLHKSCGFRIIGSREKIGQLNNTWHDNTILERRSKIIL